MDFKVSHRCSKCFVFFESTITLKQNNCYEMKCPSFGCGNNDIMRYQINVPIYLDWEKGNFPKHLREIERHELIKAWANCWWANVLVPGPLNADVMKTFELMRENIIRGIIAVNYIDKITELVKNIKIVEPFLQKFLAEIKFER